MREAHWGEEVRHLARSITQYPILVTGSTVVAGARGKLPGREGSKLDDLLMVITEGPVGVKAKLLPNTGDIREDDLDDRMSGEANGGRRGPGRSQNIGRFPSRPETRVCSFSRGAPGGPGARGGRCGLPDSCPTPGGREGSLP